MSTLGLDDLIDSIAIEMAMRIADRHEWASTLKSQILAAVELEPKVVVKKAEPEYHLTASGMARLLELALARQSKPVYEYTSATISFDEILTASISDFAAEGWELVTFTAFPDPTPNGFYVCVFRREKR